MPKPIQTITPKQAERLAKRCNDMRNDPDLIDHSFANHISEVHIKRDLLASCQALVNAYKNGEASGSIEWSDLDDAHALAKIAIDQATDSGDQYDEKV